MLLAVLALASCNGSSSQNDKDNPDDKDAEVVVRENKKRPDAPQVKVKTEYKISPGDEVGTIQSKEEYNEKGHKVKFTSYDYYGSGNIESETTYKYDDKGNCIEMNDGTTKSVYTYNEAGKKIKEAWSRPNGQGASEEISYDDKGERIETKYFTAEGTYDFSRARELKYDASGNIVEEKQWEKYTDGSEDLLQYWRKYTYDDKGRQLTMQDLRQDGSISSNEKYEYDGAGNQIAKYDFDEESTIPNYKEVSQYNEYGEVVHDQTLGCDEAGNCSSNQFVNDYKYDDYGRMIRMMYKHEDGESWGSRIEFEDFQ